MKTQYLKLFSILAPAVILVAGFGAPILVQCRNIRLEEECLRRLIHIDHDLNCIAPLEFGIPAGNTVDPKVVPMTLRWGDKDVSRCPRGPKYEIEFRVGSHPQCPYHGDLIGEVGYVPHATPEMKRKLQVRFVTPWMLMCFAGTLAGAVGTMIFMCRQVSKKTGT